MAEAPLPCYFDELPAPALKVPDHRTPRRRPPPAEAMPTPFGARPLGSPRLDPVNFPRHLDLPFTMTLAALEDWYLEWPAVGGLCLGRSRLFAAPFPSSGSTCLIAVRLYRGRTRPPVPMELELLSWSSWSTSLNLRPRRRVRPTRCYFKAGHRVLDAIIAALYGHAPVSAEKEAVPLSDVVASCPTDDIVTAGRLISGAPTSAGPTRVRVPADRWRP